MLGDWKMILLCALISAGMAVGWYGLYRLCIASRKKKAEKKGTEADLDTPREWFMSLGCFMQVIFWVYMVYGKKG